MTDIPIYTQRAEGVGGVTNTLHPLAGIAAPGAPDFTGMGAGAKAIAGFGDALEGLGVKMQSAQAHTRASLATTSYLQQLDQLEQKYTQDPDFQNAPQKFRDEHAGIMRELSERIPDAELRQRTTLEWSRSGIAASRRVRETAWGREVDANVGAVNGQETERVRLAAQAAPGSADRVAAADAYFKSVDAGVDAGWLNETERVKRKSRFNTTLDISDVQKEIAKDPERAVKLLADPAQFPNIDPIQRGQWVNTARHAADTRGQLDLVQAAGFNPAGALATTGRVADQTQARLIFDKGIIPSEGGVKDGAGQISPAGAIGLTQVMPATAREQAAKLGLKEVAALDDAALAQKLKDDHGLNYKLGLSYWNELATRYSGNLPLMTAAYNAGPSRADEWNAKAVAQFGPDYTAAQLQQVVTFKETRDYIGNVYGKLGAEPSGGSLSPEARFQAGHKISARINADEAERVRGIKDLATSSRLTEDPLTLMQAGFNPDPAGLALTVTRNLEAARNGDVTAAKYLRDLAEQKRLEPMVRGAYTVAPVVLDQTVADMEARLANAPSVSLQDKNTLDALKAVRDEVKKRKDSDPVTLGARAGLYSPVAVDPQGKPDDLAFRSALNVRAGQALEAQRLYQGTAAPFMPQEAAALKERWSAAGESERAALVQTFAETMPEKVRDAALDQIGANATAKTAAYFAATRPELAREILHGGALMATSGLDKKTGVVRDAARNKLGGEVYPSAAMQDAVLDAAVAVYTARRGPNALYDPADEGGIEKAIEAVSGPIVKRNGRRVPVPPGMSAGVFEYALDNLDQVSVDLHGGAVDHVGQPLDPKWLGSNAKLIQRAPGSSQYAVFLPSGDGKDKAVMTIDAGPLVLDMGKLAKRYGEGITTQNIEAIRDLRNQFATGAGAVLP